VIIGYDVDYGVTVSGLNFDGNRVDGPLKLSFEPIMSVYNWSLISGSESKTSLATPSVGWFSKLRKMKLVGRVVPQKTRAVSEGAFCGFRKGLPLIDYFYSDVEKMISDIASNRLLCYVMGRWDDTTPMMLGYRNLMSNCLSVIMSYRNDGYGYGSNAREIWLSSISGALTRSVGLEVTPDLHFPNPLVSVQLEGVPNKESHGQTKLLFADLSFLFSLPKVVDVIVIGGAPGDHWSDIRQMFRFERLIIFDILKPTVKCQWERLLATRDVDLYQYSDDFVLIMDIRSDRGQPGSEEYELGVADDNDLMLDIASRYCERHFISMKFRFPSNVNRRAYLFPHMLRIDPQAWAAPMSHESRVIMGPGGVDKTVSHDAFWRWSNAVIAVRKTGDYHVVDSLYSVSKVNMNYNIVDDRGWLLYTLSNIENVFENILSKARLGCVFNLPSLNYVRRYLQDEVDGEIWRDRSNRDRLYDLNDVSLRLHDAGLKYSFFTTRDFICWQIVDINGGVRFGANRFPPIASVDVSTEMWGVFVPTSDVPFRTDVQSWINGQTHMVKVLSPLVRSYYALDSISMHRWRQLGALRWDPTVKLVDDLTVNFEHGGKLYAVSGHMLNMMINCDYFIIDFWRHCTTVIENANSYLDGDFSFELDMYYAGRNLEWASPGLWHNLVELRVTLLTYDIMCEHGVIRRLDPIVSFTKRLIENLTQLNEKKGQQKRSLNDECYSVILWREENDLMSLKTTTVDPEIEVQDMFIQSRFNTVDDFYKRQPVHSSTYRSTTRS